MRPVFVFLFLFVSFHVSVAQQPSKDIYKKSAWIRRDKWQRPNVLIELLKIDSSSHVADIGCHEGYMTLKLARVVPDGKVYAVDVDQRKLNKLRRYLKKKRIGNVEVIRGEYDDPRLPHHALDAVLILDTYHELKEPDVILKHIRMSLRDGGRIIICEPITNEHRRLPRAAQEQRHELGMEFAIRDLEKAGFEIIYQKDPFIDRTTEKRDKMWVVVAISPDSSKG